MGEPRAPEKLVFAEGGAINQLPTDKFIRTLKVMAEKTAALPPSKNDGRIGSSMNKIAEATQFIRSHPELKLEKAPIIEVYKAMEDYKVTSK